MGKHHVLKDTGEILLTALLYAYIMFSGNVNINILLNVTVIMILLQPRQQRQRVLYALLVFTLWFVLFLVCHYGIKTVPVDAPNILIFLYFILFHKEVIKKRTFA